MPTEVVSTFRMSPQQRRLWTLHSDESVFNAVSVLALTGSLDARRIQDAVRQVVGRHDILRTSYRHRSGLKTPHQFVAPEPALAWTSEDLSSQSAARIQTVIGRLSYYRFDLQQGPMLLAHLIRTGPANHLLVLALPAMCADSATLSNLARMLADAYEGQPENSPESIQYESFSEWANDLLEGDETTRAQAYWQARPYRELLSAPLPLEHKPATAPPFKPRSVSVEIASTAPDVLFASWQVLIWNLTRNSEVLVGMQNLGRDYDEMTHSFGLFARVTPSIARMDGERKFSALVERNRTASAEADEWHSYFTWDPSAPSSAFFPFVFEQNVWAAPREAGGLRIATLCQNSDVDRYKLKLSLCFVDPATLRLFLHYDPAYLDEASVIRIGKSLAAITDAASRQPETAIKDLRLLSGAQKRELLTEYNPPPSAVHSDERIHDLFEKVVAQSPESIAVSSAGRNLTYAQLNDRANRLAHHLRARGIHGGTPVAIAMERGVDMVTALIGTLKAGGAYVPLDPAYPADRIQYVLSDTQAPILLTQQKLLSLLPEHQAEVVCLDADWDRIATQSNANLHAPGSPDHLAYVIYTSGSTGKPKGVPITHRNLVHSTLAREIYYEDPVTAFLLLSSFSFDSSVAGIFWSLTTGATLYVSEDGIQMDTQRIAATVRDHRISHLLCLPSLHSLLLKQSESAMLASLRAVIVAGEACPKDLVELHVQSLPGTRLYNEYGPTEATVWSTAAEARAGDPQAIVPIGVPISGAYVYLLDSRMEPVLPGMPGELFIGGDGLSRGYLGQPALTAERFVPDPHNDAEGARLYRTGDLAAYRSDGQIEFLGRADNQIKLRGYRIELGEVENVLRQQSGVQDALVMVREDEPGDRRLVAYVIPKLASKRNYRLPNGLMIADLNRNETDYLYGEIFESNEYLRHSIALPEHACVFDVGANIGMFTLFAGETCPTARIYSFEPIPPVHDILRANASACKADVKTFAWGLSDRNAEEEFTYYARSSMMSSASRYANRNEEIDLVRRFIENEQRDGTGELLEHAGELLNARFEAQSYRCRLRRLSDVMREDGVEYIHLLKIDVQRAEIDVLHGIDSQDWQKIQQIVIEAHDVVENEEKNRVERIVRLLESHGYDAAVEQDEHLKGTGLFNIYATRPNAVAPLTIPAIKAPEKSDTLAAAPELRAALRSALPEYMVPAAIEILPRFPLLPNGKVDRKALPKPGQVSSGASVYAAPVSPTEIQVASVWSEVLKLERIGIDDNFFDLGGHSFLAIRIHHRLCQLLERDIPLLKLFEFPTVRKVAGFLESGQPSQRPVAQIDSEEEWATGRREALQRQRELASQASRRV